MKIQNIWAVGRNYAKHAAELGNATPDSPIVFLKSGSCVITGPSFSLPIWANEIHHEVELALQFNQNLEIDRVGVALDLTERSEQNRAKAGGLPWTLAKSFPQSCPLSPLINISDIESLNDLNISLKVNNELKQSGRTSEMIFKIPVLTNYILAHFPVCPGDLILTGTPEGVGPIKRGDFLAAEIEGLVAIDWTVK